MEEREARMREKLDLAMASLAVNAGSRGSSVKPAQDPQADYVQYCRDLQDEGREWWDPFCDDGGGCGSRDG